MMNLKKHLVLGLGLAFAAVVLTGCSYRTPDLVNTLNFDLSGISNLTIAYDEEDITICEGNEPELVIREYMTKDRKSYHAKVKQRNGSIHISEGGKPLFHKNFTRYVEVYIPASYKESLTITSTDGNISLGKLPPGLQMFQSGSTSGTVQLDSITASDIKLTTTSGMLSLGYMKAHKIVLETTSGTVSCGKLDGNVTYNTTSGSLTLQSAYGFGSYHVGNSGTLDVTYQEVTGPLTLFNKNGAIDLTVPEDLAYEFQATSKNGSVSTTFQDRLVMDGRTFRGTIGVDPTAVITLETKNGDIRVKHTKLRPEPPSAQTAISFIHPLTF